MRACVCVERGGKNTNRSHVAIALLAGDVPELETKKRAVIPLDLLDGEVDTNSHLQLIEKHVLDVAVQDACLAARLLADNKDLEVVLLHP